jgi:hypothetical protein
MTKHYTLHIHPEVNIIKLLKKHDVDNNGILEDVEVQAFLTVGGFPHTEISGT